MPDFFPPLSHLRPLPDGRLTAEDVRTVNRLIDYVSAFGRTSATVPLQVNFDEASGPRFDFVAELGFWARLTGQLVDPDSASLLPQYQWIEQTFVSDGSLQDNPAGRTDQDGQFPAVEVQGKTDLPVTGRLPIYVFLRPGYAENQSYSFDARETWATLRITTGVPYKGRWRGRLQVPDTTPGTWTDAAAPDVWVITPNGLAPAVAVCQGRLVGALCSPVYYEQATSNPGASLAPVTINVPATAGVNIGDLVEVHDDTNPAGEIVTVTAVATGVSITVGSLANSYTKPWVCLYSQRATNNPAAGADVTILLPSTEDMQEGDRIIVSDGTNQDAPKITAVVEDVSITVTLLRHSYIQPQVRTLDRAVYETAYDELQYIRVTGETPVTDNTRQPAKVQLLAGSGTTTDGGNAWITNVNGDPVLAAGFYLARLVNIFGPYTFTATNSPSSGTNVTISFASGGGDPVLTDYVLIGDTLAVSGGGNTDAPKVTAVAAHSVIVDKLNHGYTTPAVVTAGNPVFIPARRTGAPYFAVLYDFDVHTGWFHSAPLFAAGTGQARPDFVTPNMGSVETTPGFDTWCISFGDADTAPFPYGSLGSPYNETLKGLAINRVVQVQEYSLRITDLDTFRFTALAAGATSLPWPYPLGLREIEGDIEIESVDPTTHLRNGLKRDRVGGASTTWGTTVGISSGTIANNYPDGYIVTWTCYFKIFEWVTASGPFNLTAPGDATHPAKVTGLSGRVSADLSSVQMFGYGWKGVDPGLVFPPHYTPTWTAAPTVGGHSDCQNVIGNSLNYPTANFEVITVRNAFYRFWDPALSGGMGACTHSGGFLEIGHGLTLGGPSDTPYPYGGYTTTAFGWIHPTYGFMGAFSAGSPAAPVPGLTGSSRSATAIGGLVTGLTDDFASSGAGILAFGATIPVDRADGPAQHLAVTAGTAFKFLNPTNDGDGFYTTFELDNVSGGACGAITWDTDYVLLDGAFTGPAAGQKATITFQRQGADLVEVARSPGVGGGGGMVIGGAVSGGTATYVLYVDGGGNLAESAHFIFDDGGLGLKVTAGSYVAYVCQGGGPAGSFQDGTNAVYLANGANAIETLTGNIQVPGSPGNTFSWFGLASTPATNPGTPTTRYGGNTNYLGDPDVWLWIKANGVDYKIPAFLP